MKPAEKIEKFLQKASVSSNPNVNKAVLNGLIDEMNRTEQFDSARNRPNFGRIIMKRKMTKIVAATVIITAVLLTTVFLNKLNTPAYALEDTINASRNIRSCHFHFHYLKSDLQLASSPEKETLEKQIARETWIEYGDDREVNNLRVNFYDLNSVLVWKKDGTQYWQKANKILKIFEDELYTSKILFFAESYDPKHAIENLKKMKSKDEVQILIKEPDKTTETIIVEVEYPENTFLIGKSFPRAREIFFVDQNTKLSGRIDIYAFVEGQFKSAGHYEYLDYDVPFNPGLFNLEKEVSADVKLIDMKTLDMGLERGDLSEDDIAVKVAREFLEALIEKDYTKAVKIYCPYGDQYEHVEESELMQRFKKKDLVEIISIDKPVVPDGLSSERDVLCKVQEADNNSNKIIKTYDITVDRLTGTSRWHIKNFYLIHQTGYEMTTYLSMSMAYKKGGLQGFMDHCDKIDKFLSQCPPEKNLLKQLFDELNEKSKERKHL